MLISLNLLLCLIFSRFLKKDDLEALNMGSASLCVSPLLTPIVFSVQFNVINMRRCKV
jgi:hypothetical protein